MIVIIGGTSGIGLETAGYLKGEGYDVLICGRHNPDNTEIPFKYVDITQEQSIQKLFSELNGLDGLVYSAGITMLKQKIADFDKVKFDHMMDVNVTGLLMCLKYSYEKLRQNKGKIVVVNSLAARKASSISGVEYTATKGALSGVVKQLSIDFAADGVLINSVFPSMTATPMLLKNIDTEELRQIEETIPLRRVAQPLEVAKAIEFLVGNKNTYMTGCALDINGGLFLTT